MKCIDIHGHYAWGIDDGISTKEEAIQALQVAKKNHIMAIVATPHVISGKHTKEDILTFKQRIQELKKLAKTYDISVFEGCELFINDQLYDQLDANLFIPIENTSYVLCEFDVRKKTSASPDEFEDRLYEIIIKGYTPIVAHVERYFKTSIDRERIQGLIEMGCVIQINSTSILHPKNSITHQNAMKLLENNLVHVIASDTHTATGKRCPNLKETYITLQKNYEEENLQLLFYKNQLSILKNEPITETSFTKKGFFDKLWKRRGT